MRTSPLDTIHRSLGAKMVPFGGWDMPLSYPNGTLEEHRACRTDAVAFDVSHLGTVRVHGSGAFDCLQRTLTNDLHKIEPGRAQYTHLLDPADASVVDDIIVWWLPTNGLSDAAPGFDVMPNASNTDGVLSALSGSGAVDAGVVEAMDTTSERAIIALQGPRARERLASVAPDAAAVGRFRVAGFEYRGHRCVSAGTGYTGEDGVECSVPIAAAEEFWSDVIGAGVNPAGLGARDTLRLEAALPLHGHELGPGITPLNAGLGWVISWDKGDFRGRDALVRQRDTGVAPVLRGIRTEGRRPPRAEQDVLRDGQVVGRVSSGNFSPMLECGIALAFVDPDVAVGDAVTVAVRGKPLPARCVELPFLSKRT